MKEDPESQCKLEALLPGTGASLGKPADICKYMLRKKVEIKFFFFKKNGVILKWEIFIGHFLFGTVLIV